MISIYITIFLILMSDINGESESTHSNSKEDKSNTGSDYWKNHRYNLNQLYNKYREGKSNNEPYFSEPNNNDQYETMPNTIQITAIPGAGGIHGFGGQFPGGFNQFGGGFGGGFGGLGNFGDWKSMAGYNQRPIYYISKKSDWFSWLIPLLFLLGAPFLLGIILIPVALKSIIFIIQICRNLGILLPLIPAMNGMTGMTGMTGNPIVPTTG